MYNWYRLIIGLSYEIGCTETAEIVRAENISKTDRNSTNDSVQGDVDASGNNTVWDVQLGNLC